MIDRAKSQRHTDNMDLRAQMKRLILVREGNDFFPERAMQEERIGKDMEKH